MRSDRTGGDERVMTYSLPLATRVRPLFRRALLVAILLAGGAADVLAQRVPCPEVVRALSRGEVRGRPRTASAQEVAKALGTSSAWVERCAVAYGRRVDRGELSSQGREVHERNWESREPEEIGREEKETADDVVVDALPYKDKARQRAFSRGEEEWAPAEADAWKPNTGRQWSPYISDPHRTMPDDVEGVIRD